MTLPAARRLLVLLGLAALQSSLTAAEPAAADGVFDEVGLFQPETAARANELIRQLKHDYHFGVRVETMALPEAERRKVQNIAYRPFRARYFVGRARERAEQAGFDGLFILVCTEPPYLQAVASPKSAGGLFSAYQQKRLVEQFRDRLPGPAGRNDAGAAAVGLGWERRPPAGPDAALLDALNVVAGVVRENASDPNAVPPAIVGALLGGGVATWLVLAFVGKRMARRDPDGGLLGPIGADRRSALLAAQFGTATAHWNYDRLLAGLPPLPLAAGSPAVANDVTLALSPHEAGGGTTVHAEVEDSDDTPHDGGE